MACSIGGWSRHPLPIGWATETRVGRPMEHRRARGSPRPAARRHARRRSLLPWQRRFVTPVRASTPGCLCFGSVGSVWPVRIYVKAVSVGRRRLTGLAFALASLRYLVSLLCPPRSALSKRGGVSERGLIPLRPATGEPGEEIVTSNRKDYRRYLCLTIPDCGIAMTTRTRDSSTRTLKQTVSPEDT